MAITTNVTVLLTSNTVEDSEKFNLQTTTSVLNFRITL